MENSLVTKELYDELSPFRQGYISYMQGAWNKDVPESNPYQETDKAFNAWKDGNFQAMLDVQDGEE